MEFGQASMCCQDFDTQSLIGDLTQESSEQVWHGPALAAMREFHLKRQFGQVPLCRECGYNYHYRQPWWTAQDT